jgi:hypothetical protein
MGRLKRRWRRWRERHAEISPGRLVAWYDPKEGDRTNVQTNLRSN